MRADLDARLADFECRLRDGMLAFFGDEHTQRRRFHPKLARKASAGKASAQDGDVNMLGHGRHSTAPVQAIRDG
jgi:hypothetical protein